MKDEDALLLLGLAVLVASGRGSSSIPWGDGWVWPVPQMRLPKGSKTIYPPDISQEFKPGHFGVDVMYRRKNATDQPQYKPGTPDGSPWHFAPVRTPILAARAGRIWSVSETPKGWAVVINHGKPFATFYQHLETVGLPLHSAGKSLSTGQPTHVAAGQPLGFMGFSPEDPERLRHLHFAVWYQGAGDPASIDPAEVMDRWPTVPWAFSP